MQGTVWCPQCTAGAALGLAYAKGAQSAASLHGGRRQSIPDGLLGPWLLPSVNPPNLSSPGDVNHFSSASPPVTSVDLRSFCSSVSVAFPQARLPGPHSQEGQAWSDVCSGESWLRRRSRSGGRWFGPLWGVEAAVVVPSVVPSPAFAGHLLGAEAGKTLLPTEFTASKGVPHRAGHRQTCPYHALSQKVTQGAGDPRQTGHSMRRTDGCRASRWGPAVARPRANSRADT